MSSNVIKYGLIYGITSILATFLMYNGTLGTMTAGLLGLVIFIVVLVLAGKQYKAENGGYASMGELVKTFALVLLVGLLVSSLFQLAYTMTMSEEKKDSIVENIVEGQTSMLANMIPEEQLSETQDAMYEQAYGMFNPSTVLLGVFFGFIVYIIIALIPAAIMKKNREFT